MKQPYFCLTIFFLIVSIGGCSVSEPNGELTVDAIPPQLHLSNGTGQTIYFFVADESELALVDLDLSDRSQWPSVKAGETVVIHYTEIMFYNEGDRRAWIYWADEKKNTGTLKVAL